MSLFASLIALSLAGAAPAADYRERPPEEEIIYFVLPDRFENGDPKNDKGGLKGDRLATGYDPAAKGFFHGGDLAGLTKRLDYIEGLGATAIWFAPIFKNKPVQGPKGEESAGYHGYWVTDFTQVDPHFGTNAEFKAFVDAAHARGMKVYMDIIANHTADVITYREDAAGGFRYRSLADYPFARAAIDAVSGTKGTDQFARLFDGDMLYKGGAGAAQQLPTFLGNHDMGRFSMFVKAANPQASEAELLQRVMLGHAMLLTLRGVPTIYYGDEQGFVSDDKDQLAREDMFASQVAAYNDNELIGSDATTAAPNFDPAHPLYRHIAALAEIRRKTPALIRGATKVRAFSDKPGLLAVSRFDPDTGREVLLVFNTSAAPLSANIAIDMKSAGFTALHGTCPTAPAAPGSLHLSLPAFGTIICQASE